VVWYTHHKGKMSIMLERDHFIKGNKGELVHCYARERKGKQRVIEVNLEVKETCWQSGGYLKNLRKRQG